jgi:hypothetical protein
MSAHSTNRVGLLKLWLLNLVANVTVLAVWYRWLLIPDAHGWQVAASLLLAIAAVVFVAWLRAGTLAYFRAGELRASRTISPAFRRGARHIIPLAIWAALGAVVLWIIVSAGDYTPQFSVWIRQKVNAGPAPRNVLRDTNWLLFLLLWVIVPAIWLPIASTVAAVGLRLAALVRSLRVLRRFRYWLALCVLMAAGAYVPYRLVTWVPEMRGLRAQAWSMGVRFVVAYAVLITAFVALVWMVGVYSEMEEPVE